MKISTLAIAASMLCACATASAADFDYSFLDLGYSRQSHEFVSGGNGYQVDGSYAIGSSFFVAADYGHNSFTQDSIPAFTYTNHDYHLGGGYHLSLAASTDLIARAQYGRTYLDFEVGPFSFPMNHPGYDAGLGLRIAPIEALEIEAFLDHDTLGWDQKTFIGGGSGNAVIVQELGASENVASADIRYNITHAFALGTRYSHSSLQSMNDWILYARWSF